MKRRCNDCTVGPGRPLSNERFGGRSALLMPQSGSAAPTILRGAKAEPPVCMFPAALL
jgi:hypothetical protein